MATQVGIYTINCTSPERAAYTSETSPHIAKIEVRTVENVLRVPAGA